MPTLILSSPAHFLMEEFSSRSSSSEASLSSTPPPEYKQVQQQQQRQSVAYHMSLNSLAAYETRDDVLSSVVIILVFWFFASVMLTLGFYGSVDLVLGPNCSWLVQANSLFVQDIKVNPVGESEDGYAMLYGFTEPPALDVQTAWTETYDVSFPVNFHKEWVYVLNEQAQINISYTVKSNTSSPLILVIAQGSESLSQWIENPSYPHILMSWNAIHGNGTIQQSIIKPSDYYIAVANLNQQEMEVQLQFGIRTLSYNTTGANYRCSLGYSSCALPLPFLRENVAVLTTSGPQQDLNSGKWYVKLSYDPRWTTYIVGSGVLTVVNLLILKIFTNLLLCSRQQNAAALATERSPLLPNKEDDHLSLGSSYDSVSCEEEDMEEWKLVSEGGADNAPRLCIVCCDAQRDSFFLPCGHCATCFTCGTRIADDAGLCPICRRRMKKVRKIFTV